MSFLMGLGINSYSIHPGIANVSFPYVQNNLQTGISSTQQFNASRSFAPRSVLPEMQFGLDVAGKRMYSDCHFSFGLGSLWQNNLDISGGFVLPFNDKRFSLRVGTSYYGAYGHAIIGSIDNNQKDITINGDTYHYNYHVDGKYSDTYYNATKVNVTIRGVTAGFRPTVSLVYQPLKSNVFYKINLGYNIPIYSNQKISFDQKGKTTSTHNNNDEEYETVNVNKNSNYYGYTFNGNKNQGPFGCKGLMFNIGVGIKF